jgi:hypothetical protein
MTEPATSLTTKPMANVPKGFLAAPNARATFRSPNATYIKCPANRPSARRRARQTPETAATTALPTGRLTRPGVVGLQRRACGERRFRCVRRAWVVLTVTATRSGSRRPMLTPRSRDGRADSRLVLSVREGEGGDVACGLIEMRAGGQYLLELEPLFVIEVGGSAGRHSVPKLPGGWAWRAARFGRGALQAVCCRGGLVAGSVIRAGRSCRSGWRSSHRCCLGRRWR